VMGEAAYQAPYAKPPSAPVLYIKPANTFSAFRQAIALPSGASELQARGCLALIAKRDCPAGEAIDASDLLWTVFCDFTIPHTSFHRPPVKFNAFDGSLGLPRGESLMPFDAGSTISDLVIETWVNDEKVFSYMSIRPLDQDNSYIYSVNQFISFQAGDALMAGHPMNAPIVKMGDVVSIRSGSQVFTEHCITEAIE
jgi:5-oxopent-3-ene-1,2,5-tricarboxylate decarboxylase / 2-hydroxyhepta-2,4-diene-1,7-dioate isomerase